MYVAWLSAKFTKLPPLQQPAAATPFCAPLNQRKFCIMKHGAVVDGRALVPYSLLKPVSVVVSRRQYVAVLPAQTPVHRHPMPIASVDCDVLQVRPHQRRPDPGRRPGAQPGPPVLRRLGPPAVAGTGRQRPRRLLPGEASCSVPEILYRAMQNGCPNADVRFVACAHSSTLTRGSFMFCNEGCVTYLS